MAQAPGTAAAVLMPIFITPTDAAAGLLDLHGVRRISFAGRTAEGESGSKCFGALISNLIRVRPHVTIVVESASGDC